MEADLAVIVTNGDFSIDHVSFSVIKPSVVWNTGCFILISWGCDVKHRKSTKPIHPKRKIKLSILNLYDITLCRKFYLENYGSAFLCIDTGTCFCVQSESQLGVGKGDSGSPLVLKSSNDVSLAGIVMACHGCNLENQPIVIVNTTQYLDWIETTINCN